MNSTVLLDSSVWIELLNTGPSSQACKKQAQSAAQIIVPTLVLYEVYRKICSLVGEDHALSAVAVLTQNLVVELTQEIALHAADLSLKYQLAMQGSLILAHAYNAEAVLVTLDHDFMKVPNVRLIRKES